MRKVLRYMGLAFLAILAALCCVGCYYLFIKDRPPAKRADLMVLPPDAPAPPRGFPTLYAGYAAYGLGLIDSLDIRDEVPLPPGVAMRDGVEYGRVGDRALLLDLYYPEKLDKPAPALIFIHGGGWNHGDRKDYKYYTVRYAQRGYVVASIGYRFASEAPYPACVEDAKCSVRYIRSHAAELHVDPNKIVVIGGSAGGHLSLMVGYSSDHPELEGQGGWPGVSSAVAAVVDLYGPTDFTVPAARNDSTLRNFLKKTYDEDPALYKAASPITYVKPGIPPTLIFQGTLDNIVPPSQSDELSIALKAINAPYWYDCLDGFPHTMDIVKSVNEHCQAVMNLFFDKYLKP
jgi:acetyl esterase/lipase